MTYFADDVLLGLFLWFLGHWWLVHVYRIYWQSTTGKVTGFKSSATYDGGDGKYANIPVGGSLKLILSSIGLLYSLCVWLFVDTSRYEHFQRAEHATIYFFFIFSGIVDIISRKCERMPPDMDYIVCVLAFAVALVISYFKQLGEEHLEALVYLFVSISLFAIILSTIAERLCRNNVTIAILRPYFTMVVGAWIMFSGYILYGGEEAGPIFDPENHESLQKVTILYMWHLGLGFVWQMVVGALLSRCCYGRGQRRNIKTQELFKFEVDERTDSEAHQSLLDNSE